MEPNMYINEVLELSAPVFCFLEITNLCNNKCPGCGNVFKHGREKQLNLLQWKEIIDQISDSISSVRVTGGEATLRKDFWKILDLLENKKIIFSIFSNGRWQNAEKFLDRIKKYKYFKGFLISLHGHDAKSHDGWSGVEGSFEETVNNLKLTAGKKMHFNTNSVISPYNYSFIKNIVDLSLSLGSKGVVFNRFYQSNEESSKVLASKKELIEAIDCIEELKKNGYRNLINYGNCIPHCFYHSGSSGCTTGTTFCTIDPFGNMRPCNHAEYIAGNVIKDGFLNVWKSEAMKSWRSFISEECKNCASSFSCHGGCRALSMKYGKDPLMNNKIAKICKNESAPEIKINKKTKAKLNVTKIRKESFGYLLLNNDNYSAVTDKSYDFLKQLDKYADIEGIYNSAGEDAVYLLYNLYNRGIVNFDNENITQKA